MNFRRVLIYALLIAFAAFLSIPAALVSEGITDRFNLENGTPGKIVSRLCVREKGLSGVAKEMDVELEVDAPIWFLLICATAFLFARHQRKNNAADASTNIHSGTEQPPQ